MSDRIAKKGIDKHAPGKRVLNLYVQDERENLVPTVLLYVLLGLVIMLAIGKFEVADRLVALREAEADLVEAREKILLTQLELKDYDRINRDYVLYSDSHLSGEAPLADRMEILELLEKHLIRDTAVTSISVMGNEINVQFADASLEDVSALAGALEAESLVQSVTVTTASTTTTVGGSYGSQILMTNMQILVSGEEESR